MLKDNTQPKSGIGGRSLHMKHKLKISLCHLELTSNQVIHDAFSSTRTVQAEI